MRKNISVNMVNTRSNKEQKTEEKQTNQMNVPDTEIDFETPEKSIDGLERKTTESSPMPNVEEHGTKTIELSPIGNGDEITNNTPGTIRDDSQTKRTSFMAKLAAMVGVKPREQKDVTTGTERSKTFGTVSTIITEAGQGKEESIEGAAGHENVQAAESIIPLVELKT